MVVEVLELGAGVVVLVLVLPPEPAEALFVFNRVWNLFVLFPKGLLLESLAAAAVVVDSVEVWPLVVCSLVVAAAAAAVLVVVDVVVVGAFVSADTVDAG